MQNPVLSGSHPDPDLIKVGNDFYLATTTFEWLPGVRIHHSRDLVNWELVAAPLDGKRIGDLRGVPDSGGNYIPSLSWHDGTFYLVYSVVLDRSWPWMANRSYVTTAPSVEGPWSDPVHLNSMGFDPALFWDDDGRAWFLHLWLDYRKGKEQMRGIHIQEFDPETCSLVGENRELFRSPPGWFTEGPHLFKRNGFYYLSTAIFGTYEKHATMVARSRELFGPYEVDPGCPMLTCVDAPDHPLQKAGQGYFVDVGEDQWILAHHASRPFGGTCPLGRETCLQSIEWTEDGWPRIAGGGVLPEVNPVLPEFPQQPWPESPTGFGETELHPQWNTLREPAQEDWVSLKRNPGCLSLRGRLPLVSKFGQSLVAQRLTSCSCTAEVTLSFHPRNECQWAGLICYYDTKDFIWAVLGKDEKEGRFVQLIHRRSDQEFHEQFGDTIPIGEGDMTLRVEIDLPTATFSYRETDQKWKVLAENVDMGHLSDEGPDGKKNGFTGTFIGVAVQDHEKESAWAEYRDWELFDNRI